VTARGFASPAASAQRMQGAESKPRAQVRFEGFSGWVQRFRFADYRTARAARAPETSSEETSLHPPALSSPAVHREGDAPGSAVHREGDASGGAVRAPAVHREGDAAPPDQGPERGAPLKVLPSKVAVLRAPAALLERCLAGTGLALDDALGAGSFGGVWALKARATEGKNGERWILKVSDLRGGRADLVDIFDREVYFLLRLQASGLVPRLLGRPLRQDGFGFQAMERFDSSLEDLGRAQARRCGVEGNAEVFTDEQIDAAVKLVHRFDETRVLHGDLKRANILQSNAGRHLVVADFGFAGARESNYHVLLGFVRHHRCPVETKRTDDATSYELKTPVPAKLEPFLNRWELFLDLARGRPTLLAAAIPAQDGPVGPHAARAPGLRRLSEHKLRRALGLAHGTLREFELFAERARGDAARKRSVQQA
jgi:Protein kinase domain